MLVADFYYLHLDKSQLIIPFCKDLYKVSYLYTIIRPPLEMSAEENQQKVLAYIANQSNIPTDYEWEIRHHKEMHEAYEKSL